MTAAPHPSRSALAAARAAAGARPDIPGATVSSSRCSASRWPWRSPARSSNATSPSPRSRTASRRHGRRCRHRTRSARGWPARFDAAFADRFGGRNALIALHHWTKAVGFGVSPVANVMIGRDGWLYFLGEDGKAIDRDYRGVAALSAGRACADRRRIQAPARFPVGARHPLRRDDRPRQGDDLSGVPAAVDDEGRAADRGSIASTPRSRAYPEVDGARPAPGAASRRRRASACTSRPTRTGIFSARRSATTRWRRR